MTKMQLWRGKRVHDFDKKTTLASRLRKKTLKSGTPKRAPAPQRKARVRRFFPLLD